MDTYKISLDKATALVLAFINRPELKSIAFEEAIGGTVFAESIKKPAGILYEGSMGWYCRNTTGIKEYPKLFMAFEDSVYDPTNVPKEPIGEELIYSGRTFVYSGRIDSQSVRDMLSLDRYPLVPDQKIPKSDLMNFLTQMPMDHNQKPFNKFKCSFFENRGADGRRDVDEFLDHQDLVAVRYYFGYDESDVYYFDSNRIRVVMIGVDREGRNILPIVGLREISDGMLQNSWPPPPPPNT